MRSRLTALALAAALATASACDDQSYRDIGAEIGVITKRNDVLVVPATERLRRYGRQAIPQIETALHTASENGRRHLIHALRAIGDPESTAILRHFAVYDLSADVRSTCEEVLGDWAKGSDPDRATRANTALIVIKDLRARGEAPAIPRPNATPTRPL